MVLTRDEVRRVISELTGVPWIVAALLYGSGLRLLEALELRVKDVDLEQRQITVRQGKGRNDRITILPSTVVPEFMTHLEFVREQHRRDVTAGFGRVVLPGGLAAEVPRRRVRMDMAIRLPRHNYSPRPEMGAANSLSRS